MEWFMPNFQNFLNSEVIRAGAGTGKTTKLVSQVFSLYNEYKKTKLREPKIVLTTFTRKATEELRERLFEIACEEKNYEFLAYLTSEKIFVTSIDALCFKFLSKNTGSIGYPLVFGLVGDDEFNKIAKLYLSQSVETNRDYLILLNSFSFEDLLSITQQFYVAQLSNYEVCAVDESALEESYIKKAKRLLGLQKILLLEALTNDGLSEKFYNFYQGHLDFIDHVQGLSAKDQLLYLVELLIKVKNEFPDIRYSNASGADRKIHKTITDNIKEVRKTFMTELASGDKNLWSINEELHLKLESLLREVCDKIEVYKKTKGKLSISDLLLLSLKVVNTEPRLAEDFSRQWDVWLIDEYQDTSFPQELLLKSLIGRARSIVVGDPQQSIYAFRGSRKEVFESKAAQAEINNQLSYLDINYRSNASLVYFFNDFFKTFEGNFVSCSPSSSVLEEEDNIFFHSACSRSAELQGIDTYIKKLKKQGVSYSDIVILARDSSLLREAALFLKKKEMPCYLHGSGAFSELNEVKDLQALLRFLVLPEDNLNFLHLLRSPWFIMDDQLIVDIIKNLKTNDSYYETFFKNHATHASLVFLSSIVNEFNQLGTLQAISFFINNSDIINSSLFYDPSGRREANIWKFILRLVQKSRVSNFNILKTGVNSLDLDNLDQEEEASPIFSSDQLELMTIHKSKGLKFDHVILFGIDKKSKKTTDSGANKLFVIDDKKSKWTSPFKQNIQGSKVHNIYAEQIMFEQSKLELEEGERLLYVALTRAAKSLYLSWSQKEFNSDKKGGTNFLPASSWAFICENFLNNHEWKEAEVISQNEGEKIFRSSNYTIRRNHIDANSIKGNLHNLDNLESFSKKSLSLLATSKPEPLELVKTEGETLFKKKQSNGFSKKEKLPIFTVSNIVKLLSLSQSFADADTVSIEKLKINKLNSIFKKKIEKSMQGIFWHEVLEHLVFLLQCKKTRFQAAEELKFTYSLSKLNITEKQLDKVIHFLFKITSVPFSEIIKNAFIEWEFQFNYLSCYIVEGKVDLWGWAGDTIWILDYKFGQSNNSEQFFNQLKLYGEAISLQHPHKKIQLVLLYPLEEKSEIREYKGLAEKKEQLLAITADSFHRAGV